METKKFVLGTVGGGLALFLMGGFIYGLALNSFILENAGPGTIRDEPIAWSMILSQVVMGAFVTYIFGRWASISTFAGGAKAGALIGLFLGFGTAFDLYAFSNLMNLSVALVDPFLWVLRYAVAGGVIGLILGMGKDS